MFKNWNLAKNVLPYREKRFKAHFALIYSTDKESWINQGPIDLLNKESSLGGFWKKDRI